MKGKSPAFKYFNKLRGQDYGKCLVCGSVIKCTNWSPKDFVKHLKRQHGINARLCTSDGKKKVSRVIQKGFLRIDKKLPCALCKITEDNEVLYGGMYTLGHRLTCHHFCLLLCDSLEQSGRDDQGILGFLLTDIEAIVNLRWHQKCSYCGYRGATAKCSHAQCDVWFHLPCGRQHGVLSLFHDNFQSYCFLHRQYQRIPLHIFQSRIGEPPGSPMIKLVPVDYHTQVKSDKIVSVTGKRIQSSERHVCRICWEFVTPMPSADVFWPPCCKRDRWFHRICVEKLALSAGKHFIKCPLCNNTEIFLDALLKYGVYIPDQDASWEREAGAFSELLERPRSCYVDVCFCTRGRNYTNSKWVLLVCEMCGSQAAHKACLVPRSETFTCSRCRLDEADSDPAASQQSSESFQRTHSVMKSMNWWHSGDVCCIA